MSYRQRLNELRLRAGVTDKEWDAYCLYEKGVRGSGYRSVALALGLSTEAVVGRVSRATRKLAALDVDELA